MIAQQLFRENRVLDTLSSKASLYIKPVIKRATWSAMIEEQFTFSDGSLLRIVIDKDGVRILAGV